MVKKNLLIIVTKKYFRPLDINYLKGDARKAKKILKYKPKYNFNSLIKDMLINDIDSEKKKISLYNFKG